MTVVVSNSTTTTQVLREQVLELQREIGEMQQKEAAARALPAVLARRAGGVSQGSPQGAPQLYFWSQEARDLRWLPEGGASRGRSHHSDTTLYIPLVFLYTKQTGWRDNDFNVYA